MNLPERKKNRLTEYDYSLPNVYFITICTDGRKNLFWKDVGAAIRRPEDILLSRCGKIAQQAIQNIEKHYDSVSVEHYVVMPDHIHLLLRIHTDSCGRRIAAPTIASVINQMKGAATRQVGFPLWQKGYYDHVVRSQEDYCDIWNYISGNPIRWLERNR